MSKFKNAILLSTAFGLAATFAFAGTHGPTPEERAIKARQSQMTLYAFNIGPLVGMAKGEIDYDAQAAAQAANNLVTLASVDMAAAWMEGTDNFEMEGTRALAAIWSDDPAKVVEKSKALTDALQALALVAGTDLAGLRGAVGPVGQACGACHKAYRISQ